MFFSRRSFFLKLLLLSIGACSAAKTTRGSLLIGVVSYDQGEEVINAYQKFNAYLASELGVRVELEPAYNENKAIDRIDKQAWSLAFVPPGIAALAISKYRYVPVFAFQQDLSNRRAVLVVLKNSPIKNLQDLQNETVVLGQIGSATGYYFPIYNLYGLSLSSVVFASSPKMVLELLSQGKAAAGALSLEEFNTESNLLGSTDFRILYTDAHPIPPGLVLVGPNVERNFQEQIVQVMKLINPDLAQQAKYLPNAPLPDYAYMISVVEKVRTIGTRLNQKPAKLFSN